MSADLQSEKPLCDLDNEDNFVGSPSEVGREDTSEDATLASNVATLSNELDGEREARKEERFIWVCALTVMFDVVAVQGMSGSWAFLPIFLLQLVMLAGYAKHAGVDWAEQLIGQLLHRYLKKGD